MPTLLAALPVPEAAQSAARGEAVTADWLSTGDWPSEASITTLDTGDLPPTGLTAGDPIN